MKFTTVIMVFFIDVYLKSSTSEARAIDPKMNEINDTDDMNNATEIVTNPPEEEKYVDPTQTSGKFEGDILLPPLEERNAVRNVLLKWPEGRVPYEINTFFGVMGRIAIALAASEFATKTCIRLVPRTNETDYVSIIRGGGCWSMVGRMGGEQEMSLGGPCQTIGIIEHEFMHALGFWHEQSRVDRDDHVTVNWENIYPGSENNFQKHSHYVQQTLDEDYDYGSVLHYSMDAFSKNGRPTIVPKNLLAGIIMGQRFGFSATDVRKINKLYNCVDYL